MEITTTELMLFAWAIIATGFALKFHEEGSKTTFLLKLFIEDEKARNQMLDAFNDFKQRKGVNHGG